MKFETTKKRYILFRRITKGVVIILWILCLSFPILILNLYVSCENCSIPYDGSTITSFIDINKIRFYIWGFIEPYISQRLTEYFTPPNLIYYLGLVFFWIGFILNFGNIKQNYKNKIINKNLGYCSALIILIAIIGIFNGSLSVNSGYTHSSISLNYKSESWDLGIGLISSILLIILICSETFILNRIVIISEKQVIPREETLQRDVRKISGKVFCASCGAEITDLTAEYCSKCGSPLK